MKKDPREIQREKLKAALEFAYEELCEIERLASSKEQALHILRAIGFCKWDKQPEWNERIDAAIKASRLRLHAKKGNVDAATAEACRKAPGPCTCGVHITELGDWPTEAERFP